MINLEGMSDNALRYLIDHTELKEKAWEQLLKQSAAFQNQHHLINNTDKEGQDFQPPLKHCPDNKDLGDEAEEVWEQLANKDLCYLIVNTDRKEGGSLEQASFTITRQQHLVLPDPVYEKKRAGCRTAVAAIS